MAKIRQAIGALGRTAAIAACLTLPSATIAVASTITIGFTGEIITVPVQFAGVFTVGQAFSGSYSYQSDAPNLSGSPTVGLYGYDSFAFNTAGLAVDTGPAPFNQINIVNNVFDAYRVDVGFPTTASPNVINGYTSVRVELQLTDLDGSIFSDTALPLVAPSFADFAHIQSIRFDFRLDLNDPSSVISLLGQLDDPLTTTVTNIPAPAPLALLLMGVVCVGMARRARSR